MNQPRRLGELSMDELRTLCEGPRPVVGLVPVGSVEPHGPHLPLGTDTLISMAAIARAAALLEARTVPLLCPAVPYGVTEYARAFPGAVSIAAPVLTAYLRAIAEGLLRAGLEHVCFVNNHLEPDHDAAVREAVVGLRASVATPLEPRFARTLGDEFRRGECHAGRYETSLVLAERSDLVGRRAELPEVPVSLSRKIADGVHDFRAMGLARAYAGAPAAATAEEGAALYMRLAEMIATTVLERLKGDS